MAARGSGIGSQRLLVFARRGGLHPDGADGFCFEPVPHINNALNLVDREPAMPIVAPGKAFNASVRFRAVAR
jgi:galactose mutarotase-like enzyme